MSRGVPIAESLRRSFGWTAAVGVLAYAVADASLEFFVLIGAGVGLAWLVAVRPQRPAPAKAINAGLLGVMALGLLQLLRFGFTVNAFAYFIGLLLVVKLFDVRRARDWGQGLVLVTGLYISAVLTSNSMMTGLLMIVGTVGLFRSILRYQLLAAAQRGGVEAPGSAPELRRDLRSLQFAGGFGIVVVALVAFLFLPRNLGSEAFGNWGGVPTGQTTGFTDEVQLGGPGLISQSPTPVMDVTVVDRNERNRGQIDAPPLYLRGAVLESYEAGRWRRDLSSGHRGLIRAQFIPEGTIVRPWIPPTRLNWELELRVTIRNAAPGSSPLFMLWQPLELRTVGSGQFIAQDTATGVVLREGASGRVEYVTRALDPRLSVIEYPENARRSFDDRNQVPEGVAAYARRVLQDVDIDPDPATRPIEDDVRAVRAMENHLQSAFAYTLQDEPVPPGREPTVWFLTERRRGHCEYYASALALMARSVGINARVVTGYVGSDFNAVTGQYVVRESNAHGWVEAEVAPGVWLTFDGTPPTDFYQIHQPTPSLWRSVKKLYETAEFAWVTGVVGFNADSQRRVLGDLATDFGLRRFGSRMIERMRSGGGSLVIHALMAALITFCVSLAVGLGLVYRRALLAGLWASWLARLRLFGATLRGGRADWGVRLHRAALGALASAGTPKPSGRPLRTHLDAVSPTLPPPLDAALREASDLLYRARFARAGSISPEACRRAIVAIRSSENHLRRRRRGRAVEAPADRAR